MGRMVNLDMKLISTRCRDRFDQKFQHNRLHSQNYLNALVESIKHFGYLPGKRILIYDDKSTIDLYQLILGLARFRAAEIVGFTHIPAIIVEGSLSEKQLFALIYDRDCPPASEKLRKKPRRKKNK